MVRLQILDLRIGVRVPASQPPQVCSSRNALLLFFFFIFPVYGQGNWQDVVKQRIALYGHRNWIVVADSAYPAQARSGVETIVADADQVEILKAVLDDLKQSRHVRPIVYLDRELSFLSDDAAPGVSAYKQQLSRILGGMRTTPLLHEQIISKLDKTGETFRVLIVKSRMTVPYTSVFLQLDCAYWTENSERKLRTLMSGK